MPENITVSPALNDLAASACAAALIITDSSEPLDTLLADKITVVYRPRSLVAGMGCRRGVPVEELERLLVETFQENSLALECLAGIATAEIKRGEPGLEQLAERHGVPLSFFSAEELNEVFETNPSAVTVKSERAYGLVGVWGVAEPAALLTAGSDGLVVTRKNTPRATIAVARKNFAATGNQSECQTDRERSIWSAWVRETPNTWLPLLLRPWPTAKSSSASGPTSSRSNR